MLGYYPVRVLPSKTAIAPVNPTFLPRVRIFSSFLGFYFPNPSEFEDVNAFLVD